MNTSIENSNRTEQLEEFTFIVFAGIGGLRTGFIEVHRVTPVSELGPGYLIDPSADLVPLCPNCHSMAHKRKPPFGVGELKELVQNAKSLSLNSAEGRSLRRVLSEE